MSIPERDVGSVPRMIQKSFAVSILGLAIAMLCPAQDTPTITVRKSDQVSVVLEGIRGSQEATAILKNDLGISPWIDVVDQARGTFIIRGNASDGGVSGQVVDRNGGVILSNEYSGGLRAAVHAFADDIVMTLTGKEGIASSRLAFVSNKSGRKEIYLCDYDGANVVQLTRDGSISVGPSISTDGRRLLYTGYKSGYADIYLVDISSGARNRVIKSPGTNTGAAFSPDGGRMALTMSKDGNPELYVAPAGGGSARRLTRTRGVESSPAWSPDGREIVYTNDDGGRPQLYRISAGGSGARAISTGHSFCTEPSWSPDGSKIAFNVRQGGGFQVAVHDLQNGTTRVVTGGGSAEDPAWGADSRHLVYSQGGSLYLLDAQTGRSTRVLSGVGKITEPSWSR